ncbi:SGNH/GDSL hydrolase family protein [Paenibacillus thermoaerophilus]|uniref:SGNH/GDSL hydrolase family protein n=1 Tax=Paenibacillus thermoaerophilus TaxID=1215385 RepID=A0ABW2V6H3_9BACL|nr:SGNH/GDSL hydrolase family protein [Paenibacillus thermoaerophilus]
METIGRGLVAVKTERGVYVGWRWLGTEPETVAFNLYRDGERVNGEPIAGSTNYLDERGTETSRYVVRAVMDGRELRPSEEVGVWRTPFLSVPIRKPEGGVSPDGVAYTYSANDASVGDLDGDGEYEIVLKWDPSNSHDNAHAGYTGNVYLDAYKLDGRMLWRIDLGRNIRAGAHYTQFLVYDFDGDGRAEIACKTADATVDGQGSVIGDPDADYRNERGFILDGPEYLTVFDGETGQALATVDYIPPRGDHSAWGDSEGNRVDRFLACVAYLDGVRPSLVMCRGYYTRTVLAAFNYREGRLTHLWTFDSKEGYPQYEGQGNHSVAVADVDGDGKDEIVYGSCVIDHDGTGLYTTGLKHGDAMHVGKFHPDSDGFDVFQVHEVPSDKGIEVHDAGTGEVRWGLPTSTDIGRGMAADIDPRYPGAEVWGSDHWRTGGFGLYSIDGRLIAERNPQSFNFAVWWDGDLLRELLDHDYDMETGIGVPRIDKWDYENGRLVNLFTPAGCRSNNGTKGNPCLQADLFGDWREEVIFRSDDSTELRIYTTTIPTEHRIRTLMHDPVYRLAVAWQNVCYNQPPHPGFYLGHGMKRPPEPDIYLTPNRKRAGELRVYLAGDSTVQTYRSGDSPQAGWGQYLGEYLSERVEVFNRAIGGRSSRTFVAEGRLEAILRTMEPGDYLLVQLGHNDATKNRPERYTDPDTDYKDYLRRFVDGARERGGVPILVTPVGRLHVEDGRFLNDFEAYCRSMKEVAAETNVPLIDLMELSLACYAELGYDEAAKLFMVSVNGTDHTHFTQAGAREIARLVARGLRGLPVELAAEVQG